MKTFAEWVKELSLEDLQYEFRNSCNTLLSNSFRYLSETETNIILDEHHLLEVEIVLRRKP